jgi:glycosyltransferase involved in cell wall biosynthesis
MSPFTRRRPRIAVVSDLAEERWHSMDLVAEILMLGLRTPEARLIEAEQVRPALVKRITRIPAVGRTQTAQTMDRIINRVWDYGRWLQPRMADFDLFHIVDHSYAHLVSELPAGRSLVMCHDIDAFAGVLPGTKAESAMGRVLARRLLNGLIASRKIVCGSYATRNALVASGVVPASQISVVPYGVHPSCRPSPDPRADVEARKLLGDYDDGCPELLHVGSTIPRKRIDVLLKVFAALRERHRSLRLIRVGGAFTRSQQQMVDRLGIGPYIRVLPFLERRVLASVYRRAAVVLQPSEREGFGLPVAEAKACGAAVVASDLPPLREVGGEGTAYCAVGDIAAWTTTVSKLLDERMFNADAWRARCVAGIADAKRFDALEHARRMIDVYRELLPAAFAHEPPPLRSVSGQ